MTKEASMGFFGVLAAGKKWVMENKRIN